VPCWVRELDDSLAYMQLATSNAQSELSALEHGLHALRSGMDVRAYAENIGRKFTAVQRDIQAARVAAACTDIGTNTAEHFSQLVDRLKSSIIC
jgi:hypothetical protein